jgi:mannonate dehydratase
MRDDKLRMIQTMRWFGTQDPVPLAFLRMSGVTGIVSSLHHIANGEIWDLAEIQKRKSEIESYGLKWSVVESIPVHEDIKLRSGNFRKFTDNYCTTIRNLAQCGIHTICYNFMPLLDWTRTDLRYPCEDGSLALAFEWRDLAIFDLFINKRQGAESDYPWLNLHDLEKYYSGLKKSKVKQIEENILMGLPGAEPSYSLATFKDSFKRFSGLGRDDLRHNLISFLQDIVPVAEEVNCKLAIHPDDPPVSLFGLPRVVSTEDDITQILNRIDSPSNGFTFCSGSYGADPGNDLPGMIERLGDRLYFIHLRNIKRIKNGSFFESNHLDGDVDMMLVVKNILKVMQKRNESIPMRPDHGHQMLDDLVKKDINPGYTAIGRMRGLAELRGLEHALS